MGGKLNRRREGDCEGNRPPEVGKTDFLAPMYFLGIDSGTQSTKAIVVELETGNVVASAQEEYGMVEGLPAGHLEQDPGDWIAAVEKTVGACIAELGDRKAELRGIGVSGQQHGLVVLDGADQVVRAAKLWCDTSTSEQCDQFAAEFGGADGLINLAGNTIAPGYTIPKLLWLKQNEPENFAKVESVLLPHDYINFWLTGEKRMEYGDASGTGVLDVRKREWCQELLDFVDPRAAGMFPPLGSSKEKHGELREELRERWGLDAGVLVSAGGGDNMMGAIGTGNIKPGVITASFGTSGTLYAAADSPVVDLKGEVAAFCDSTDLWLPLVCTMNVTVASEQMRSIFGWEISELEAALDGSEAGADGVLFLPYLNGERTPNLPHGCGVFYGMRPDNATPQNLARAAVEGATLGLAYGLNRFRELGIDPSEIRLTGGGSKSSAWRQIAADVFGVEVVGLATSEGAGLGAAVQATYCYLKENGKGREYEDLCGDLVALDESTRCVPDPARVSLYREKLETFSGLTAALKEKGYL